MRAVTPPAPLGLPFIARTFMRTGWAGWFLCVLGGGRESRVEVRHRMMIEPDEDV